MSFFKKQGTAWVLTAVMILLAIFIGLANAPVDDYDDDITYPAQKPEGNYYVYDDARVLSSATEAELSDLNWGMDWRQGVVVAVVTTNYGRDDLYDFALEYAERIELEGCHFIVVLDIEGENYWLVQGSDLRGLFTDDDCANYAWDYMEDYFAAGDYDRAVLSLVEALEDWYGDHYSP